MIAKTEELFEAMEKFVATEGFYTVLDEEFEGLRNIYIFYPNGFLNRPEMVCGFTYHINSDDVFIEDISLRDVLENYAKFNELNKDKLISWRALHFMAQ